MSRIGKLPVTIPAGVKVAIDANALRLEGPKGKLQTAVPAGVEVKVEGNVLHIERRTEDACDRRCEGELIPPGGEYLGQKLRLLVGGDQLPGPRVRDGTETPHPRASEGVEESPRKDPIR